MKPQKALDIGLWVVSGLLAALFFVSGGAKFIGLLDPEFAVWGYPLGVPAMVGILEVLGAVGLLFPRTAGWSALGLMVIMLGAIWTMATHEQYGLMLIPIATFVMLGLVVWGRGLVLETRDVTRPEPRST